MTPRIIPHMRQASHRNWPLPRRPPQTIRRYNDSQHLQTQPAPTAPRAVINIKAIRQAPEYHAQNCINRNYKALSTYPARIVELYDQWAGLQKSLRGDRERHNALSMQLRKASKEEKPALVEEARGLKEKISVVEEQEHGLDREMKELALSLPNTTHLDTPIGSEPRILGYINEELASTVTDPEREIEPHTKIGADLKLLDFADAGVVSGWGWYYLLNEAVLLEQALVNYALTLAMEHGWQLVTPPTVVYSHMAAACGFRPRDQHGEQQMYHLNDGRHVLAGTAEIPLAGMNANKTFGREELPKKVVGIGRAYRAEAGARGLDSKGLYRVHEFTKVELFAWAPPPLLVEQLNSDKDTTSPSSKPTEESDTSISKSASKSATAQETKIQTADEIFDEMLKLQTVFLASLGLYARILEMPSEDLGASASRKVDIEAYIPSRVKRNPWGEVSSLSNCTDYQSRRLNTKVKQKDANKTAYPYTLNGTACAIPRVMIAILENGWSKERQGVVIPEVLRPFMGGIDFIGKKK